MIVVTLTDCPPALRGDLTRWMQEINTGVYVGQMSARVREELWERIRRNIKSGRATMVFSSGSEQRMDFRVHNTDWEPIDFDGLKLMLRPSSSRMREANELRPGFSNAAKMQWAKRMTTRKEREKQQPERYVALDVETTGLSIANDKIIELGALLVDGTEILERFHALIKPSADIPPAVGKLTGISSDMLRSQGRDMREALLEFLSFAGDLPVVSHNASFDFGFLRAACERCGLPLFANRCVDTLKLARRLVDDVDDYKLTTLTERFGIRMDRAHRSEADCLATKLLYEKLMELS